ncbi:MAG: hypothetical protein IT237_10330 [Bacteroidia bacterium]|nr:hypothetical protein [Bacteroidia bacterium]
MRKILGIICCYCCCSCMLLAQSVSGQLMQANVLCFHQKLYVYGFTQENTQLNFKCYAYDYKLNSKDSITYALGKATPSDYLEISTDTIHQVLNFYFQLANQKNKVEVLRTNDSLKQICILKDVDVTRINAITAFDNEKYVYGNNIYVIRASNDSTGAEFYLSKYELKDINTLFEYNFKWQFPFERQFIHRASVLYANSHWVLVYVNVIDGAKKGQWILKINAQNGQLKRGTKLSAKGDDRHFLLSSIYVDTTLMQIDVLGSIYEPNLINFNSGTYNFTNQSKAHQLFLVSIDSIGDVLNRTENPFPLPIQTKSVEGLKSFHTQVREFKKLKDNSFEAWLDIYEQSKPLTFCYYSSWFITISPNDAGYTFTPSKFFISTKAIPNFISFNKGDMYGKFILNSIKDYDRFKYQKAVNSFITYTDIDDLGLSSYILVKRDLMKASKSYNYIFNGKKGLENKVILKSEQGQKAFMFLVGKKQYISFLTDILNQKFELKLNSL